MNRNIGNRDNKITESMFQLVTYMDRDFDTFSARHLLTIPATSLGILSKPKPAFILEYSTHHFTTVLDE